jgi:putative inorganic carbon (HCO3(-)) transporter
MAYVLAAATAVLAIAVRPPLAPPGSRWLDAALLLYVAVVAASLVPLPPGLRFALSPSTRIIDLTLRLGDSAASSAAARPLSIDPAAGRVSLALATAMLLLFLSARTVFARGGVRVCVRSIAALGLLLAAVGMAQHLTAPRLLYWTFPTRSATPFGPYMNHSDFATWLVMALPLTAGYLIARLQSRRTHGGLPAAAAEAFDNTAMWLTTAIGLMAAGLVVGLSRSGLIAAGAGLGAVWVLSAARMRRQGRAWLLAGFGAMAVVAAAYANTNAISARINETIRLGLGGRSAIWRETLPMMSDFWLTGVGPGSYERGMIVYQQSPRVVYFNHAHNEYLQIAAEGGLLLALPVLVIAAAGAWRIRRSLSADRTPIYWVRAGAVGGLVAVAVQSLWETGLRVPANGLLFAVVAAIAMHDQQE